MGLNNFGMKRLLIFATATIMLLSMSSFVTTVNAGDFLPTAVTDQTPTAPLSNPIPSSYQPRYISGFGVDDSFTIFFEDRDASGQISYVSTTTGPTGFPSTVTSTNIVDTHFCVKDDPINIGGTDYDYRAWGSVGNNMDHKFYVSNDLSTWTLVSTFTIPNAAGFTNARGWVYYGFHDVIELNGKYYAFAESNQGQTMICRSNNGDDVWEAFASVGGTQPTDGPLQMPESPTPSGSFIDLGNNRGFGKLHVRGNDAGCYLAINDVATQDKTPAEIEAAFINPANWKWNDGSTGLPTTSATPILSSTSEHDVRECWVVPRSSASSDWIIMYDADFGSTDGGKALGYASLTPPSIGTVENIDTGEWFHWIQDAIDDPDTNDNPGDHDTIVVHDPDISVHPTGGYVENVVVDKELTIQAGSTPVIDAGVTTPGGPNVVGIDINADDVTIDGLEIINARGQGSSGIVVSGHYRGVTIQSCIVHNCNQGISFYETGDGAVNTIDDCTIYDIFQDIYYAGLGISIWADTGTNDHIVVSDNEIYDCARWGIGLATDDYSYRTQNNVISGNIIYDNNPPGDMGIVLQTAEHNIVSDNEVYNMLWGIGLNVGACYNDITDNHIYDNEGGLAFYEHSGLSSDYNTIEGNTIESNTWQGVLVDNCDNNEFTGNTIDSNWIGIHLINGADGNIIEDNTVSLNNPINIYPDTATNTVIVGNTISNAGWAGMQFENGATGGEVHYNNITGNGIGIVSYSSVQVDATCNWWGDVNGPYHWITNPSATGDSVSDTVIYCPWLDDAYPSGDCIGGAVCWNTDTGVYYCTIQAAIDAATPGDHIEVIVASHAEGSQIHVTKDITIFGSGCGSTVITPTADTGTSGDSRGWWLIDDGVEFHLADMTLDGSGYNIYQALRHKGYGTIDGVCFTEIKYLSIYNGVAVAAFGTGGPVDVTGCTFDEIGRVGVLYFGSGVTGSVFDGNSYTGKGGGDWLDYCLDISAGVTVTVTNNFITDCTGVASSDGSNSAGVMVTTYYGAGTAATIEYNDIFDCTYGIAVGYDGTDTSSVVAHCNRIVGNDYGVDTTAQVVDATCNWWGDCSGPSGEGPGVGDSVSTNVVFDPWVGKVIADADGPYYCDGVIQFDGTGSVSCGCGLDSIVSYLWDFGDGTTSTEEDPVHTYYSSGVFTVSLTVTGSLGGSDTDTTVVHVQVEDDCPIIVFVTPEEGEYVDGTYTVSWYAIDDDYPGNIGIPIWLYYRPESAGSDAWRQIGDEFTNNVDIEHGEYRWDTSGYADDGYYLRAMSCDGDSNYAEDTILIHIDNGNAGVRVSDVEIFDYTVSTTGFVKDGDTVVITAGITGRESSSVTLEDISADLSGFGLGVSVHPDSFDGFVASWTLVDVVCIPSDGPLTVSVMVFDSVHSTTIIADNTVPEVNMVRPLSGVYLYGYRVLPFGRTFIIGSVDVEVGGSEDIVMAEFFVDGVLLESDSDDLVWTMNIKSMVMQGMHELVVVVYDGAGNAEQCVVGFTMVNPFGLKW